jgi:cytochrome c-type biogenesis protein CcmH
VQRWEQLMRLVPPDSDDGRWLADAVARTRAQMGGAAASAPPSTAKAPATAGGTSVSGRVSLAPALASKAQPGDTVFIFARPPQGSRMPLAVQRARVSDLPLSFKLDDSMAMSPQATISSAAEVRIEVRVSRTGSATPAAGDLVGTGPVVKPGATGVEVTIDQVRP